MAMQDRQASSHFVGAIRHQFSPRIVTLVSESIEYFALQADILAPDQREFISTIHNKI
jgi:hypothetical protein